MDATSESHLLNKGYAYHEAGHAVAHFHFGRTLVKVELPDPDKGRPLGATQALDIHPFLLQQRGVHFLNTPERAEYYSELIMISLAGEVAQKTHCRESFRPAHSSKDRANVNV